MSEPQAAPPARRRARRWIVIVVLAVPVALIAFHLLRQTKPVRATPAQIVSVATAATGDMPVVLNELGTVTPVATVTVLPQLSGYLTEVGYHEGQEVAKGQFLAQIDPRQYQISKQQAQAQLAKDAASLAQARADLARYAQLAEHQSIAAQTYQDAQFTVQQDEAATQADRANIAQYDLDLAYCHITAPVAGRVGLRLVDPGNYVTSSSTTGIVVITQMKPMTVQFTVPQNALSAVIRRVGAGAQLPVTVYSSDDDKQVATGTLYAIGNQMATATGTVTLRATFANDDEALFPNEFVNVRLGVDTLHDAVLVPTAAVQNGAPGDYVYLVNANRTVSVHKVTLGPSNGRSTAILAGLAAGQQVVTDGVDRLSDGAAIRIASNRTGAALPASGASAGGAPRHAGHRAAVAGAASGAASGAA